LGYRVNCFDSGDTPVVHFFLSSQLRRGRLVSWLRAGERFAKAAVETNVECVVMIYRAGRFRVCREAAREDDMRKVLFWLGIAAAFLLAVSMYISMFPLSADQSPIFRSAAFGKPFLFVGAW
jgi:hypothetical protein